jgi:crossover junction endodeoxyribonuclease RusA
MTTARLVLPWPPSKNRLHRAICRGRYASVILSQPAREYYTLVRGYVGNVHFKAPSRLRVTIHLHGPTRRAYDLDGRVVGLLDALEAASVFENDSQIDDLHILREPVVKGGRAVVIMEEITK